MPTTRVDSDRRPSEKPKLAVRFYVHELSQMQTPADLTTSWLQSCLRPGTAILNFDCEQIGTGQVRECYRVKLIYGKNNQTAGPPSVIPKVASQDPSRRSAGVSLGLYQHENSF